jgi:hypothetical protein
MIFVFKSSFSFIYFYLIFKIHYFNPYFTILFGYQLYTHIYNINIFIIKSIFIKNKTKNLLILKFVYYWYNKHNKRKT